MWAMARPGVGVMYFCFQLSPSPSPPSARATCRSSTAGQQQHLRPPPSRADASRSGRQMRRVGIPHFNLCATCSRYVHVFRHRCLVCGCAYCRRCVGAGMGDMTEGRKCLEARVAAAVACRCGLARGRFRHGWRWWA
ncbi:hypothetical protein ZWY2020_041712 [Hordeum vulgare]|nr:hypothetical protein ZWY2020_041712 [Hordeum vulgare]